MENKAIKEFNKAISEMFAEATAPLIDYCEQCGKKRKIDYQYGLCNQCWSDNEKVDEQMRKEYGY